MKARGHSMSCRVESWKKVFSFWMPDAFILRSSQLRARSDNTQRPQNRAVVRFQPVHKQVNGNAALFAIRGAHHGLYGRCGAAFPVCVCAPSHGWMNRIHIPLRHTAATQENAHLAAKLYMYSLPSPFVFGYQDHSDN